MSDPETIRAPIVLYMSVKYMRDVLMDQDFLPPGQSYFQYQNQSLGEMSTPLS